MVNSTYRLRTVEQFAEAFGGGLKAADVALDVAFERVEGTIRPSWAPYLTRVVVNGVELTPVPAEFCKGGEHSLACTASSPDIARKHLGDQYCRANKYL